MALRAALTDLGREYLARFMATYDDIAVNDGYRIFHSVKWGEGGFQTVSGIDVPKDPNLFVANTDLEIIENPGLYTPYDYASGLIPIDLTTEVIYTGGANQKFRIIAHLDSSEENDDGFGSNPRFFEIGIFDNALATGVDVADHMIVYCTFDGFLKTNTRTIDVAIDVPMAP